MVCGRVAKGGGSRPREGYPTVCGSVDAIAEHKHIYEAACVDTNPDVDRERLTHFRESGQRQVERSCVEFYTKTRTYHQRITFITKMSPFYLFIPTFTMRLQTLVSPTYHSHITSIPNPQQASPRRNPRRRRALRRGRREPPGA